MAQLEREIAKYEELRSELERDHFGQWVVIYSGKLVGTYDDFRKRPGTPFRTSGGDLT